MVLHERLAVNTSAPATRARLEPKVYGGFPRNAVPTARAIHTSVYHYAVSPHWGQHMAQSAWHGSRDEWAGAHG